MSVARGSRASRRPTRAALLKRAAALQRRLATIEEALSSIALGDADAIVAHGSIYTLASMDDPFRSLVEWMYDGAATLAPGGEILYCNRAFAQMFGSTREELLGQPITMLILAEDRPKLTRMIDDAAGAPGTMELEATRVDGAAFPVRISVSRIARAERFALLAEDLSDTRDRERELARSNAELQRFAYVASHDLKEPLRLVASYVELLALRYRGRLDEDADEFIGYAAEGAKRMHRMIDDLLQYSHVHTRGKASEAASAEEALADALASLKSAIEDSGAVITHDPLPDAWADPAQLRRVFTIFLDNALMFRGAAPPRIHVAARRTGADWMFSVRDNGIGIDPQQHDHIFLLFQRIGTSHEGRRAGMGLAVARRIVERHRGRVWVESELGEGATFHFTLPAIHDDGS